MPAERAAKISAAHKRRAEAKIAWMPAEYRKTYRYFVRSLHMRVAEAQAAIRDLIAADQRREAQG